MNENHQQQTIQLNSKIKRNENEMYTIDNIIINNNNNNQTKLGISVRIEDNRKKKSFSCYLEIYQASNFIERFW